ncbi:glucan endo-1,3-beta-glucosidase-like [Pistacia vera]|uniref:glucan endo-1,3-beta-glucosidase-like n=1 Tax=Pistacia vera TaxID=55513 RepID=UPI00126374CF|nr:glucan endo-1,3-beta-glucosidase-like [Pistacia vera]
MSSSSSTALLIFISFILQISATTTAIGVNYGTLGNNLPPPAQVADFLATKTHIDRIKIFDTNPEILRAFANTNISVTVTAGNGDIPALTKLYAARQWVVANIAPYYPQTKIIRVVVGNEILQSAVKDWIYNLVPAMKTLNQALVDAGFKDIKVR